MYKLIIIGLAWIANLSAHAVDRPNILWIYGEDTSPWMGCYGDLINEGATPNIDSMAKAGVKFERAYVPAPVCSATRSAIIVGQSGIRFGAHEHRSSRKGPKIYLPEGVITLPEILQAHGYTTFNHGKTDYNFVLNADSYNYQLRDRTDYSDLVTKQPFFAKFCGLLHFDRLDWSGQKSSKSAQFVFCSPIKYKTKHNQYYISMI